MSSLPLGLNQVEIQRSLTTSAVAIFVPFTTQELYQNGSEALYCGLNALSNNLIMVDRKFLKNPNGLILGTPGSGKSFAAKREIANVFFVTNDDIIICDPEAEYGPLVERLHGQVIKISPTSPHYINPMDLNLNYSDDENPLSLKSDFILSLCELIVGGKDGLQPVEKTIIDRCVRMVYRDYLNDPKPENMPVLEDLYQELRRQEEKEAQYVATALEIYVTGSLNVFNHRTNVDIQQPHRLRLILRSLASSSRRLGCLSYRIRCGTASPSTAKRTSPPGTTLTSSTCCLKEEQTAAYTRGDLEAFQQMGRHPDRYHAECQGSACHPARSRTSLKTPTTSICSTKPGGDRQILAKQLNISPHQLSYVTHSGEGEGLLFYGNIDPAFRRPFPQGHRAVP